VAAAHELLINAFVTTAAVSRGQLGDDNEAMMLLAFLVLRGLVAVETVNALLRVHAHLVLVDHGVLLADVALGTLAAGPNQCLSRLLSFNARPGAVDEESSYDEPECDHNSDEH